MDRKEKAKVFAVVIAMGVAWTIGYGADVAIPVMTVISGVAIWYVANDEESDD